MRRTVIAGLVGALLLRASGVSAQVVNVEQGALRGSTDGSVTSYKGIPFAAPPVGQLRWRPPAPAAHWKGVRDATRSGPQCIQVDFADQHVADQSEDCLTVNVWKPAKAKAGAKLPVMVWIYGGGFIVGGNSVPAYDGAHFAERGVVLVSLNYRLGRLGFFAHPALAAEGQNLFRGNYGVMDAIATLKWVQRNIAKFGGDPNNVTIFGQSAGGMVVNLLMTSPQSRGLFQKAASLSGGFKQPLPPIRGGAQSAEAAGQAFAEANGISGSDPDAARALRALPAEAIAGQAQIAGEFGAPPRPMIDGQLVTESPFDTFRAGRQAKVPYIAGGTDWEASLVRSASRDSIFAHLGPLTSAAKAAYGNDPEAAKDIATDLLVTRGVRELTRLHQAHGSPAYGYSFAYLPVAQRGTYHGTPHGGDVLYFMNNMPSRDYQFYDLVHPAATPADRRMASAFIGYLINFARTGSPGRENGVAWPAVGNNDTFLEFRNDGIRITPRFRQAQLDAISQAPPLSITPPVRK